MVKRNKSEEAVHVGAIVPGIIKTCRTEPVDMLERIIARWNRVVGETVAENARPFAIKGDLLLVHVGSSVWLHQLLFMQADILNQINQDMGNDVVTKIKFKIGPLTV